MSNLSAQDAQSQAPAPVSRQSAPRRLIDAHTAGVLPRGTYEIETRIYPSRHDDVNGSGITFGIAVGITDRFMFGGGYGADGIVGRGTIRGNPWPGLLIKYRLIEETYQIPAIAIGYDWQGYGGIEGYANAGHTYRGYVYKSQGFFIALSKNYLLFSSVNLGFHGAVNYSMEDYNDVRWPNAYVGMDIGINEELALSCEYDLALNERDRPGAGYANLLYGYLNAGIRWSFVPDLTFEFSVKDLLQRKLVLSDDPVFPNEHLGWSRELKLVYVGHF
jgi:hypothetical protein